MIVGPAQGSSWRTTPQKAEMPRFIGGMKTESGSAALSYFHDSSVISPVFICCKKTTQTVVFLALSQLKWIMPA